METVQIVYLTILVILSICCWVIPLYLEDIIVIKKSISMGFILQMISILIIVLVTVANNRLHDYKKEKYEEVTITLYKKINN